MVTHDDEDAWASARSALLARHRFAREQDGHIRIVLGFGAVRVGVRVGRDGQEIRIVAEIADERSIDPTSALRWNAEIRIGAIALVAQTYVVSVAVAFA